MAVDFARALEQLLAFNAHSVTVVVSGPGKLDPTLALLSGRQRDAEQLGADGERWLFHLDSAGSYCVNEDDLIAAGWESHGAFVLRGRRGRLEITPDD